MQTHNVLDIEDAVKSRGASKEECPSHAVGAPACQIPPNALTYRGNKKQAQVPPTQYFIDASEMVRGDSTEDEHLAIDIMESNMYCSNLDVFTQLVHRGLHYHAPGS
eukprot:4403125-Amphidinium_carterae.1